ncbi:D-2-hydroxyacid dehydrogenase family protein [Mucilaginibacter sp. L196]|uniref:D-2-hydroxyacid dehydrogenase family protein n=1 Tax=Mucilaginibacter sp. L196 TaxID=1641870 RepID=UPI00131C83F1|nr:D-2-hydroxyacid dehydrogenase family protein [Mucilaginibacter sp. L196]
MNEKIKVAVLNDYQQVALSIADWSVLNEKALVTVFHDHQNNEAEIIERFFPFSIICVMRERTPLSRNILEKLTNLKLIVSTGKRNASIDIEAAEELGIKIIPTGYIESGAPELTWALIMAIARKIPMENKNLRSGGWQTTVGTDLKGKTIGIIGLGRIGTTIAKYARAFDMKVIAWSQNLTEERAEEAGVKLVQKEILFKEADFITVHLVLSERSKGIVTANELRLMKPSAFFINTSRGPLVEEKALLEILQQKKIAGAALDVFDIEPLPVDNPFRKMDNVLATPHIGYVTEETYSVFYKDTVKAIGEWLK